MRRHLVLVGLPGSGKTTVGSLAADALGARFVDIDAAITAGQGIPVARIFEEQGEAAFRRIERDAVLRELGGKPGVMAPGGGWAAQMGNLESVVGRALTVYLRVSAAEAANRVTAAGGTIRPLLQGTEPAEALARLLDAREAFYRRCDAVLEADGRSPAELARQVVELARSRGGW